MRVNPDSTSNLISYLSGLKRQQESSLQQIASGRRVQVPSDDPAAMAAVIQNTALSSRSDEYLQSISSLNQFFSTADGALNAVVTGLERAVTLGVEGGTGTLSEANRKSLAQEVSGIREQVLSLANLSFRGAYVFAGARSTTQPFVEDSSSLSGIRYDGSSEVNKVEIGDRRFVALGLSGDTIFDGPGANVFGVLHQLTSALESNDIEGIRRATTDIRGALDHVSAMRVSYGNSMNQLELDQSFLEQSKLQMESRENDLIGADPAEAISRLQQVQFARDATLAAAARTQYTSLLDYLE